jgi:hypothetical protein
MTKTAYIDIVMTATGGPYGELIEVENDEGRSIKAGEWFQRADGYWVLRIKPGVFNGE